MSKRRLFLLLLIVLGLGPGLFWRSPLSPADYRQRAVIQRLGLPDEAHAPVGGEGGPVLAAAWAITSAHPDFGGYSALVMPADRELLAISDKGKEMRLALTDDGPRLLGLGALAGNGGLAKSERDAESATRDPISGRIWVGYENSNAIRRYEPNFTGLAMARPQPMRGWSFNSGPEAILRLVDGRFLVLSEGTEGWEAQSGEAVLFESDPVAEPVPRALRFRFPVPAGYRVTDMAALPDGKVLLLLRGLDLGLPPRFTARLVVADPADIEKDSDWPSLPLGELAPPIPIDNFEGLAIQEVEPGRLVFWIISDDNDMGFQRTLLLKFLWTYPAENTHEKARGNAARHSVQAVKP